ncbi:HD domain-containing protein [Candidatus Woesearchaeota archaeon]|nr:HD domain-containing protein [Candidatus Woesearchaeota archaeon]
MYVSYRQLHAADDGVVSLEAIVETIAENYGISPDIDVFVNAYNFSKEVHEGDIREEVNPNTNTHYPFFSHPSQAAMIVAKAKHDYITAAISVMHDTIDISGNPKLYHTIKNMFGREIAKSVAVLTGFDAYSKPKDKFEKSTWKKEVVKNCLIQTILYPRAFITKLSDRIQNFMSIDTHSVPRKERVTFETLNYIEPLGLIADPILHEELTAISGKVQFEHPFMLDYENNLNIPYDQQSFTQEVKLMEKMGLYQAGRMDSIFINSRIRQNGTLSNEFSNEVARAGFDDMADNFKDIPGTEVEYLRKTIRLVQQLNKELTAESYIGMSFPIHFGEPSSISQVKAGENALGHKVYSLNITTDNFSEETIDGLKSKYTLRGPLYVMMEEQPRYRMIFDGSDSPIINMSRSPVKDIIVNIYTK